MDLGDLSLAAYLRACNRCANKVAVQDSHLPQQPALADKDAVPVCQQRPEELDAAVLDEVQLVCRLSPSVQNSIRQAS